MKAQWKGTIIAESNETIIVEGNHYFPSESIKMDLLTRTDLTTTCPWKGKAIYYTITVGGEVNENAAWSYPDPKEAAQEIRGHIAFYGSVEVGP